jgi:hypothetical protein
MADFVAVIRRAVDGLSDNTPEMRVKVYEKARGAVRRQLEAMNPRPSEELVKRQLDKLENAITDVEGDHAEALPSDDVAEVGLEPVASPVAVEEVAPVAEPAPEPITTQSVETGEQEPEQQAAVEYHDEPAPAYAETADTHVAASDADPVVEPESAAYEKMDDTRQEDLPAADPEPHQDAQVKAEPTPVEAHAEPSWHVEAPAAENSYVPSWNEPEATVAESEPEAAVAEPRAEQPVEVSHDDTHSPAIHDVVLDHWQEPPVQDVQTGNEAVDARMPAATEQWNWDDVHVSADAPASEEAKQDVQTGVADPAWDWPVEKVAEPEPAVAQTSKPSEWSDLEDLIGYDRSAKAVPPQTPMDEAGLTDAAAPAVADTAARPAQRSFRAEPRKSRINVGAIVAVVALLAIVGGAGAGYWMNRDAINDWVADLTASSPATPVAGTTGTQDTTSAERSLPTPGDASNEEADGGRSPTTEVASVDNTSGKFTQRLLADGNEIDEGPAAALDGATTEEGKSVAAQSEETAQLDTAQGGDAASVGTDDGATQATDGAEQTNDATTGTEATPADTQPVVTGEQPAAVGVAQKMFLYEERLGQTGPTAIEGTVAWSLAEESPGGDAKAEPVVRAQINVPSSGLTALVTFRRNQDRSLPASHLVEIVFSLPDTFEGGGIESVQRVAMKQTEQDRGDPLIAVPAKITDDFHMIALNDFPEAITRNTELMRTRNWIDIPITYRNGRRALITLDKGTSGIEAFDTAMKAWATLAASNSQ